MNSRIPYRYSADDTAWHQDPALGENLGTIYTDMRRQVLDSKNPPLAELDRLIADHPDVPHFSYLHSEYLLVMGYETEYRQIRDDLAARFPDYIFSRLHLVESAIEDEDVETALRLLGKKAELHQLFPARTVFHELEALHFEMLAAMALGLNGRLDLADERVQRMFRINPGHLYTDTAMTFIVQASALGDDPVGDEADEDSDLLLDPEDDHAEEDYLDEYDPLAAETIRLRLQEVLNAQVTTQPVFSLPATQALYGPEINPGEEAIRSLLSADRATLISDLEKVLEDCVLRFEYQATNAEPDEFIALHALYLLAEIEAHESQPAILRFLCLPADLLEFWLGDALLEDLWEVLYRTCRLGLDELIAFAQDETHYTMARVLVPEMLAAWGLHEPNEKDRIIPLFRQLLRVKEHGAQPISIAQQQFISVVVNFCKLLRAAELIPEISRLYAQGLIDEEACGSLKKLKIEIQSPAGSSRESAETWKLKGNYTARISRMDEVLL